MDVLYLINSFIDSIFIKGLFVSVLSIIIAGKVLKTDTCNAFAIIKWIILVNTAINIVYYYAVYFSATEMMSFDERVEGHYDLVFYLMLVPNTILPLLLLFKKLGHNKYVLLTLSLLMNMGWMFEIYLMYSADLYVNHIKKTSLNFLWFIALKGLFVGSVIYAVGRLIKRRAPDKVIY